MLLTGTYIKCPDEKGRLSIPKPIRQSLGFPGTASFYLAPGTDESLVLYTETKFSQLAEELGGASPTGNDVRVFSRLFYAQAQRVEMDRQGRIRIPVELASLAGIGKEVVLLGVRDHLEIWDRSTWEEYLAKKQPHYDEIAERALAGASSRAATQLERSDVPLPVNHPR